MSRFLLERRRHRRRSTAPSRDGVDVLNLSLGGPRDRPAVDPLEHRAAERRCGGRLRRRLGRQRRRASAGAVGIPRAAPWTTAVAATTGARTFRTTLEAAPGGAREVAASDVGRGIADARLVDARELGSAQQPTRSTTRATASRDDARARGAGKVVICDVVRAAGDRRGRARGTPARWASSCRSRRQCRRPGDRGHAADALSTSDAAALRGAVAGAGRDARPTPPRATPWAPDRVAGFSSRGPSAVTGDLLRPDVAAPGVNVLAAYAPDTYYASIGCESRGARSRRSRARRCPRRRWRASARC